MRFVFSSENNNGIAGYISPSQARGFGTTIAFLNHRGELNLRFIY
jgi:hypothetical protein